MESDRPAATGLTGLPGKRPLVPLVPWTGRLPAPAAQFLSGLGGWDLPEVYVLVGRFEECRRLITTARRLHLLLEQGPHAAASGHWTFEAFMTAKRELSSGVRALEEILSRIGEESGLAETGRARPREARRA